MATEIQSSIVAFQRGDIDNARGLADARAQLPSTTEGSARQKLFQLQEQVGSLPQIDCPLQHVFAPDAYARTIFIPAGAVLVGKIHKHQHLNILSMGRVSVFTEEGGVEQLQGPLTMVSPAGCKRAVLAHTDTVWTTIHVTKLKDLAEIEDFVIAKTYEDYEAFAKGETL